MEDAYTLSMYLTEVYHDALLFISDYIGSYGTCDEVIQRMMTAREVCCHGRGWAETDGEDYAQVATARMRWDEEFINVDFPFVMGRDIDLTCALEFDADIRRYCVETQVGKLLDYWNEKRREVGLKPGEKL